MDECNNNNNLDLLCVAVRKAQIFQICSTFFVCKYTPYFLLLQGWERRHSTNVLMGVFSVPGSQITQAMSAARD